MKKIVKIILAVVLLLIVVGTFVFLFNKSKTVKPTYAIETADLIDSIEMRSVITGSIEPRDEVLIKPQMNGIVAELFFKAGDAVKAGDVIARLSVVPDMIQLSSAQSRVQSAQIAYNKQADIYMRDKELHAKGIVSDEEYQVSKAGYEQEKESLAAAQEALDITRTGVSKSMAKSSTTLVRSTVSGTILEIPVKVGNSVIQSNTFNDGTTIASIADMSDLLFIGKVDESEVGKMKEGMSVKIRVGALGEETFPAVIEFVAPKGIAANDATQFEVKAAVTIPVERNIRAAYSANAEVVLERASKVIALPEACLVMRGDSVFVNVVTAEKPELQTEQRAVELGVSDGVTVEIKKGLKEGEKVRGLPVVANR